MQALAFFFPVCESTAGAGLGRSVSADTRGRFRPRADRLPSCSSVRRARGVDARNIIAPKSGNGKAESGGMN